MTHWKQDFASMATVETLTTPPGDRADNQPSVLRSSPQVPNFARQSSPPRAVGKIGPWQLVRMLSESDFSRVYAARPAESSEDQSAAYAIKVLRKEWWSDPGAIEMQRRAAWLGQTISHSNLLPILSASVGQPPFYLVSPRLEGRTLAAWLEDNTHLPLPTMLWIARQVADGLTALHEKASMVHGDVKPENIVVSTDGHATLIDLGFAHHPEESLHWSSRPVIGTLHYIAPETVASRLSSGPQSDIYSLGVTLYQMLASRLPFPVDDASELMRMHRETAPECLRLLVPSLPKPVASLIHWMMAKNPLRRPESARDVSSELTRLEIACFGMR
jgi:serine/threonine protein kinase